MPTVRDVINERKRSDKQFEGFRNVVTCVTAGIDQSDDPAVNGRSGYIWVREMGADAGYFQVYNPTSQRRVGIPVFVAKAPKQPYRRVVLGINYSALLEFVESGAGTGGEGSDPYLINHAETHEWLDEAPGKDPLTVYARAMTPFRATPSIGGDLLVAVAPGFYTYRESTVGFYGANYDISSHVPASGFVVRVLVYFDPSDTTLKGLSSIAVTDDGGNPPHTFVDSGLIPCAYVKLTSTTTVLDESMFTDARVFSHSTNEDYVFEVVNRGLAAVSAEHDFMSTLFEREINANYSGIVAVEGEMDYRTSQIEFTFLKKSGGIMTGGLEINIPTATETGLIIKTTDGDSTKNLLEAQDNGGNKKVIITPAPADGGLTSYDIKVGDVNGTPTYGMIQIGNASIGRTSYNVGNVDLDGAILYRNIAGPVTSQVEHIFTEATGNTCRFALPSSGVGNATYNPRSMLLAGPAPADTDFVTVGYWQTNNSIFDNLACDTAGDGADLGVQNDLEVEGDIFTDSIKESTGAVGIKLGNNAIIGAGLAGIDYTLTFDGEDNDGVITWMEDEDHFEFGDDVVINDTQQTNAGIFQIGGGWTFKESSAPTADAGYGKLWTETNNELFFQSGDGQSHLLHGDAFSEIWFHAASTVEVTISTEDAFTKIDSFTVVGNQDDLSNVVGSAGTNDLTLASIAGGEYEVSFHASITATGGADKEMLIAMGIILATPKDITNVTDDTVTPIVITSTAHGLEDGDMVEIVGVLGNTAANGSFIVDNKAADTFEIVKLDGVATVGNGDFDEGSPTGDVTIEYPGNMIVHREVRGASMGAISATGLHILLDDDVLAVYVANLDGTTNLTVAAISFDAFRIGD